MLKLLKRRKKLIYGFIAMIAVCFLLSSAASVKAASDSKKPTLTVSVSNDKPTNKNIVIQVTAKDSSGIKIVKYAKGVKTAAYFKSKGTIIKLDTNKLRKVTIKSSGTYTFYTQDKAGNVTTKKVVISNIDKTLPVLSHTLSTSEFTNTSVKIQIKVSDKDSGIKNVQYLSGKKEEKDFINNSGIKEIKLSKGTGTITLSNNGTITLLVSDKAGNKLLKTVTVKNIDKTKPSLSVNSSIINQKASVIVKTSDKESGVKKILYIKGSLSDTASAKWNSTAKDITKVKKFTATSSGTYSILTEDNAGNKIIKKTYIEMEMRAVWISYLEFQAMRTKDSKGNITAPSYSAFKTEINKMFDNCKDLNMNAVIVQVRPFGDALYKSSYFPWSATLSGEQGKNPGYDPLKYMIEAAHERDMEIHAWINPYRVTGSGTDVNALSTNNKAYKWRTDSNKDNDRYVLTFDKKLYYNPSVTAVQTLIVNGVKEIVENYDIDGIHFDDYFYPTLGSNYKNVFDNEEYSAYVKKQNSAGKLVNSIPIWRRNNVNSLVKKVNTAVKTINSNIKFGISPAGNIDNLNSYQGHYVDIKTWLASDEYIDYICPQIYWSFEHKSCPYDKTVDRWLDLRTSNTVNMYIGIAVYKGCSNEDSGWKNNTDVLKTQVEYARETGLVDGFMFYRYESFGKTIIKPEIENLKIVLNNSK